MDKLTLEQKQIIVATNHYLSKFNSKIQEEAYGDTASWKILDRWLSEILDVDYKVDIYNNKHIFELSKLDSVKSAFKQRYPDNGWYIGDALKDSLYTLCHYNMKLPDEIDRKEKELREMWSYFKSILPMYKEAPKPEEIYVMAGVTLNGEALYKKVTNQTKNTHSADDKDWFLNNVP